MLAVTFYDGRMYNGLSIHVAQSENGSWFSRKQFNKPNFGVTWSKWVEIIPPKIDNDTIDFGAGTVLKKSNSIPVVLLGTKHKTKG